jgi:ADP-heptose:LPS heptosyltransferase
MQRLGRGEPDAEMRDILADLRTRHFDLALQCSGGGETTNAFVRALRAAISAGQQWPHAPPLRLMDLMELIGAPRALLECDLDVTSDDEAELARAPGLPLAALRANQVIGVGVGAGSGARCWPTQRFAEVIDAVLSNHPEMRVVLTGTSDELTLTRQVLHQVAHAEAVIDLAGQLSLGGLLALVSHLRFFLGNDSAPAHFATALKVPSVVIFGSAHPAQWAWPNRVWHRAVADETAPCRRFDPPCGCPDDARAICIDAVSASDVLTQVEAVLELISSASTQGASQLRSGTVVGRS